MGTNQAYEAVEMHYLSASRRRPQAPAPGPQENIIGEPVYHVRTSNICKHNNT